MFVLCHDSTVLADHFAGLVDLLHNVVRAAKDCMRCLKQTINMAPVSMCLTTLQSEWKRKEITQNNQHSEYIAVGSKNTVCILFATYEF